mmetsp:Transcript_24317/g.68139  ORF Transcript_24317/g.68139 Transcript_24317/m.68139 type:complete len:392 (+) Transcript_24317:877-2052(+)
MSPDWHPTHNSFCAVTTMLSGASGSCARLRASSRLAPPACGRASCMAWNTIPATPAASARTSGGESRPLRGDATGDGRRSGCCIRGLESTVAGLLGDSPLLAEPLEDVDVADKEKSELSELCFRETARLPFRRLMDRDEMRERSFGCEEVALLCFRCRFGDTCRLCFRFKPLGGDLPATDLLGDSSESWGDPLSVENGFPPTCRSDSDLAREMQDDSGVKVWERARDRIQSKSDRDDSIVWERLKTDTISTDSGMVRSAYTSDRSATSMNAAAAFRPPRCERKHRASSSLSPDSVWRRQLPEGNLRGTPNCSSSSARAAWRCSNKMGSSSAQEGRTRGLSSQHRSISLLYRTVGTGGREPASTSSSTRDRNDSSPKNTFRLAISHRITPKL